MAESIVSDWLSDYSLLEPSEIRTFSAQHEHNHEVASALFTVLNERLKYPDLLHSICNQFFDFYRSNENNLQKFTLQFLPTLIYIYLNSVAQGDKKSCRSVETLLLGIYNIEICNDDGQPKTISFRMPVLAQASIYHEEKNLNASDLRRWEDNSNKEVNWGPLQQIESINAQNRIKVMTALLFSYNQQLCLMPKSSLSHLCRISSLLVNQGFSKLGHAHRSSYGSDPTNTIASKPLPRISVSSQFLLELLHAVYFAMFNDFGSIAIQTVDDIHNRACYELYPEVIMVTSAIKNSLHQNPSGQPADGPMGLSVALTPVTSTVTVSKSMITNASFRTKKLPDDIPIQGLKDDPNNSQLLSISEELEGSDTIGPRNTSGRGSKDNTRMHKVPFPGFAKKSKDKDNKMAIPNKNGLPAENSNNIANNKDAQKQPPPPINKREKFVARGSLQSSSNDFTDALEKISPVSILKRKTSNIETANGGIISPTITTTAASTVMSSTELQLFSNGSIAVAKISDEKISPAASTLTTTTSSATIVAESLNNSIDATESNDTCSSDNISVGTQRPSIAIDLVSHNINNNNNHNNNMQVSQV